MSEAHRTTTRKYDTGQPTGISCLSYREGRFLVKPFRHADGKQAEGEYLVDLQEGSCTCPHHEHRIAPARERGEEIASCKHYDLAREESFQIALHISRQLSPANLRKQLLRTDLRDEITEALLQASWEQMNRPSLPDPSDVFPELTTA